MAGPLNPCKVDTPEQDKINAQIKARRAKGLASFSETWKHERAIPERDDTVPLCVFCCTEPATEENSPYCSAMCAIDASNS